MKRKYIFVSHRDDNFLQEMVNEYAKSGWRVISVVWNGEKSVAWMEIEIG